MLTVKKRLIDSIVTPLTSTGRHLALDIKQALRFWRPSSKNGHTNNSNHGLVVQIEDQDGRGLIPSLHIQNFHCQTSSLNDNNEKACECVI